jgi:glycosyltransferase involved in cell wall biosynthesis
VVKGPKPQVALYLGIHDLTYPRNASIRRGLVDDGWVVVPVTTAEGSNVRKFVRLLLRGARVRPHPSVVILSEFSVQFAVVAWLVALRFRCPLVVDFFVGMHETRIEDHRSSSRHSLRALLLAALDRTAVSLATFAITDTQPRADRFTRLYRARPPLMAVAVEAPAWAEPGEPPDSESVELLYYGNYIPLHGIDTVVGALGLVEDPVRCHATFIGGDDRQRSELAAKLRRSAPSLDVTFVTSVREEELGAWIARSDLVFGVFGTSVKASEVVANKVWQALVGGRKVVTRTSAALEPLQQIAGASLVQVAPGDEEAIARCIDAIDIPRTETSRSDAARVSANLRAWANSSRTALLKEIRRAADA